MASLSLLLPLCFLAAPAPFTEDSGPGKPYKSPQMVFQAWIAANDKGDNKAFVTSVVDPDSRLDMAARFVSAYERIKVSSNSKTVDAGRLLAAVMVKHGFRGKGLVWSKIRSREDEHRKARELVAKVVTDMDTFLIEALVAVDKMVELRNEGRIAPRAEWKLIEVKIDGNKASGTMVISEAGTTTRKPVHFRKRGNGWRLVLRVE
jgi:hypothetical protein